MTDIAFYVRQWAGKARRWIWKVPRPPGGVVRLHLGCGSIDHPGFVNIDGISRPHVHHIQSVADLSNFTDGSVDFIYTSHVLEHFPRDRTHAILCEWFRTLAPGGRLCVSVPDFDRIVEIYAASQSDVGAILPPLFGGQDYPFNFHYTAFTEISLSRLLLGSGFSKVHRWEPGSDRFHSLPDWSGRSLQVGDRRIPISLNLEALK